MLTFQEQFDALAAHVREVRSQYHVTLGELIDELAEQKGWRGVFVDSGGGVGSFHSYRGHYADLAMAPTPHVGTVRALRRDAEAALGHTFEGYKGGDFTMGRDAPLWIAADGRAEGLAVVDIVSERARGRVRLITKRIEW